jgi:hypothetical protein
MSATERRSSTGVLGLRLSASADERSTGRANRYPPVAQRGGRPRTFGRNNAASNKKVTEPLFVEWDFGGKRTSGKHFDEAVSRTTASTQRRKEMSALDKEELEEGSGLAWVRKRRAEKERRQRQQQEANGGTTAPTTTTANTKVVERNASVDGNNNYIKHQVPETVTTPPTPPVDSKPWDRDAHGTEPSAGRSGSTTSSDEEDSGDGKSTSTCVYSSELIVEKLNRTGFGHQLGSGRACARRQACGGGS